jgi:VIT1/CCC1 family predicted Fe2+/Mn2+ transporter
MQAAVASAASFTLGGLIPFAGAFAPTPGTVALSIVGFALAGLLVTGILSARTAGKDVFGPTVRVMLGGAFGMAVTAGIGRLLHINLG